jgi:hypothetical protein
MRDVFLDGIARHLADNVDTATYNPDGIYTAGQLGIIIAARPADPADLISISAYSVDDDPTLSDSTLGLQVWARRDSRDPRVVGRTADAVFDTLHGLHDLRLPSAEDGPAGVWLTSCERRSHVSGGQDDNGRWAEISNFYCLVHYPSTHRI